MDNDKSKLEADVKLNEFQTRLTISDVVVCLDDEFAGNIDMKISAVPSIASAKIVKHFRGRINGQPALVDIAGYKLIPDGLSISLDTPSLASMVPDKLEAVWVDDEEHVLGELHPRQIKWKEYLELREGSGSGSSGGAARSPQAKGCGTGVFLFVLFATLSWLAH